jgi:hypothetical protein
VRAGPVDAETLRPEAADAALEGARVVVLRAGVAEQWHRAVCAAMHPLSSEAAQDLAGPNLDTDARHGCGER